MHPQKIGWWVLEKTGGDGSCLVRLETASNFLFMKRACASFSFEFEGFLFRGQESKVILLMEMNCGANNSNKNSGQKCCHEQTREFLLLSLLFVRGTQYSHWHVNWIEFEFGEERFGIIFPFAGNSRSKAPAPKGVPHLTHQIRSKCVFTLA